jgi:hypothetical protein
LFSSQSKGGDDEPNPYLEGTPAYIKTLPTKAEHAKQEILVRQMACSFQSLLA